MRVQPKDRFLRLKEIRQRIGLSQSTIYRMMKDGTFPSSLSLGARTSVWLESEVEAWISARQPEEREAWTSPPPPARRVGEKKLPPLVPNEKGAEAAARIAGVVGLVIPPDDVPSDRDIALRFPDWPEMMRQRTAAAYLDLSESAFIREVYRGTLPNPVVLGGRQSWSRKELDASIARLLMRKQPAR
ncbi:AlpA family phage regulatory protein [Sphingomonas sp. CFBP 13728]|uniref:helix-turn-helix transcriptional regulator n=1 Tax=Sphingomonas sp. CFBP 13728 TaxID=2775294 RepID=UPI0017856014|nr:AlpA family phage regulatory protein [Sphingomonas sp. CFBP 13728]MBD8620804.1 AlpA family phage regulatory protein [Sphingomonas sp. CFBP 13728]